ncbi:MAG: hypothetical protein J3R72DRAFT_21440 [Linnemannia gamsii]|nr:MAG: hypothetical protein J3R72DRAFT_21440 [Linnemannia gamsii]
MTLHQRFRLGNEEVEYLAVRQDDNGPPYSRLDDIQETFSGASRFKVNGITLNFLTDRNGNRYEPRRLAHYPDNIIDVVCATPIYTPSANAPVSLPARSSSGYNEPPASNPLSANAPRSSAPSPSTSMAVLSTISSDIVHMQQQLIQAADRHSAYHQQHLDQLAQLLREEQVDATERDERMLTELAAAKERDAEILQLQEKAIDILIVAKQRIDAAMVQSYELHEYIIPRLFVILPDSYEKWDPRNFVNERFRLHFLCEGGGYCKADSGHGGLSDSDRSNNPTSTATGRVRGKSDIHIALHEGYELSRPIEFIDRFGLYVQGMLLMLKYSTAVPAVVSPAFAPSESSIKDEMDGAEPLSENIINAVNMSIKYLEKAMHEDVTTDGVAEDCTGFEGNHMFDSLKALEGADLRRLETFFRKKDADKVFGNLYRITTETGHVKWVCLNHYRQGYRDTRPSPLRSAETNGASYDPLIDDVTVELKLRTAPRDILSRVSSRASTFMSRRSR